MFCEDTVCIAQRARLSNSVSIEINEGHSFIQTYTDSHCDRHCCVVIWGRCQPARFNYIFHKSRQPIGLTILHWGDQGEERVVASMVERFQREHPLVQVTRINVSAVDFDSKLKTMLAAGTPPDLFYLQPESLAELASLKLIASIDDRFAKEPREWKEDFFPMLLDVFRYNTATQKAGAGGKLYGIPKDFTTAGFYVNLDLFHQAGVPVPYNGWTWDEFEADMKKITALGQSPAFTGRDIYGGYFEIWQATLRNILWTYGGEFFGDGGFRDVLLDSPGSQAALQMIVRTRLKDKTVINSTGLDKDGGQEFYIGNIGCTGPVGRWKGCAIRKSPNSTGILCRFLTRLPVPRRSIPKPGRCRLRQGIRMNAMS